ncbi:MAG TPA: hypothetical protein PLY34_07725 [Ferruginibacter sp.]|nr:hypothetical protein [Ferruginibacter sp.]HPH91339.1 hypothetical protein [Ferruginibacter sp.]
MKKLLLIAGGCFVMLSSFAQSEKFTAAMKKNLAELDSAFKNPAYLLTLANNFERIASAEKTQWLPYYYAAFCQVNNGFMEKDKSKIDAIADKATELINKADSLSPGNSEISCIKSMIASCHMMVNPMQRWQEYGAVSNENMEAAMKQDPANPRPFYLKGQGLKYTPEQFGGGCKTAVPVLETALEKFTAFKPASELHPNWGKEIAQQIVDGCK